MMSATPCFVGIDVAKAQLDIALRPTGERWAVANLTYRAGIVKFMAEHRLPGMFPFREFVQEGGLLAYGPDYTDMNRRPAAYVAKILMGATPAVCSSKKWGHMDWDSGTVAKFVSVSPRSRFVAINSTLKTVTHTSNDS
jgi:hypothetical protein